MAKNTHKNIGSGIRKKKKGFKEKSLIFLFDTLTMITLVLKWITKHFWKLFFLVLIIFLLSKYSAWNNKRMASVSDYWDAQEEVCGFGYVSETGDQADCHPLDYLTAK